MGFHRGQHVRSSAIPGVALWFVRYLDLSSERANVIMVGDDREHEVEVDSLTRLDEDDFCSGCGQIGCTAYGSS